MPVLGLSQHNGAGAEACGRGDAPPAPSSSPGDEARRVTSAALGTAQGPGEGRGRPWAEGCPGSCPWDATLPWGGFVTPSSLCPPRLPLPASCCSLTFTGWRRADRCGLGCCFSNPPWPGKEIFICSWIFIGETGDNLGEKKKNQQKKSGSLPCLINVQVLHLL